MAGVAEPLVSDLAGFDVVRSPGRSCHGRSSGERSQPGGAGEPGWVIADRSQHPRSQNGAKPGTDRRTVSHIVLPADRPDVIARRLGQLVLDGLHLPDETVGFP